MTTSGPASAGLERVLTLHDGRQLAIVETGDPDGVPVLFFHGTPGSRLTGPTDPGMAAGMGVRSDSRDDLVECAALLRSVRNGELDRIVAYDAPLDVLAQQIVAEVAARDWEETALYERLRRAWPFRKLRRSSKPP